MKKFLIIVFLLIPVIASAETITLKSGRVIKGEIIEQTDEYTKINFKGVDLTFYADEIEASTTEIPKANKLEQKETIENTDILINNQEKLVASDEDYEDDFIERISLAYQETNDIKKAEKNINNLTQFSFDYPESRFADDAQFLPTFFGFLGSATEKDEKGAEVFLKYMKKTANAFPTGILEKETIYKLNEMGIASGAFYIPYDSIVVYMKGFLNFHLGNFKGTISEYSTLIENLDFNQDKTETLSTEIYIQLAISYSQLGQKDGLMKVRKEAENKFPENVELLQMLKRVN